jgi:hypothetical protein
MPRIVINYIVHPLRRAEWGELLCAIMGVVQFLIANFARDVSVRPGLEITLFWAWVPKAWVVAGLVLACAHILALRFSNTPLGYNARIAATAASVAFWTHLVLSVAAAALVSDQPMSILLSAAIAAPLLSAAVLYRLWRHY